jgi:tripartite-type tricarboxylate transporter receptor subunit TctC
VKNLTVKCLIFCSAIVVFTVQLAQIGYGFYEGKTIRVVVGFSAGGGFDSYSRTLARHLPKHIAGNPTIIVQNMPGAGSLTSANYVYNVAKPDGLTIGHFIGGLFLTQILEGPGIEFDARKFEYIGAPVKDTPVCILTKSSGIPDVGKWLAASTPVKLGASAPGNSTYDHPKMLKDILGFPIQIVGGYKGTADIRLAAESGEVAGGCWTWDSIKATSGKAIEAGELIPVLQLTPQALPDLPKVPLAISYAKTEEARRLIQAAIHDISDLMRPYVTPPGTPKDRVQLLREAFHATLKDRAFIAEANKSKLTLDPVSGNELEMKVTSLFGLPPSLRPKLKNLLTGK